MDILAGQCPLQVAQAVDLGQGGDGDDLLEVFADEEECRSAYSESESEIPETASFGVEMIGNVPTDREGVDWSDRAKAKVGSVLAKGRMASQSLHQEPPQLFYDRCMIEDDLWEDLPIRDPAGIEEEIAIAMAMSEALEQKADDRAAMVRQVTEEAIGRVGENIVTARRSSAKSKIIVPR